MASASNYFTKGEYNNAIERCQIGINIMPDNAVAAYNMGLYLVYAGETKKASSWWRRSLLLDPELMQAYRSLHLYYLKNNPIHDSVEFYAHEYQKRGGVLNDSTR
jgi:tetratricopeptide (TPR) repeat protein